MRQELVSVLGSSGVDNLIAKLSPAAETFGVVIAAGAGNLKRGSVLAPVPDSTQYALLGAAFSGNTAQSFRGDGTANTFTVTAKPSSLSGVTLDGETLTSGTHYSYNSSTGVVTLSLTKSVKFSGDGSQTDFTVTDKPASVTGVTVGGVAKTATTDYVYTAATGVLAFTSAPASGTENIVVTYGVAPSSGAVIAAAYAVSGTATGPACVLADDADASGETAVTAVAYRSGNFNRAALIVASGYSLTAADEDALRKYDIILTDMMD